MSGWKYGIARRGVCIVIASLMVVLGGVASGAKAQATTTFDNELFTLINQDREQNGLPALRLNSTLGGIAETTGYSGCGYPIGGRAQDLINRNYFSHTILGCGTQNVFNIFQASGVGYSYAGENIGWEGGIGDPVQAATYLNTMYMQSPEHRANILNPNFTEVGVGSWTTAPGQMWTGGGTAVGDVTMSTEEFIDNTGVAATPAAAMSAGTGWADANGDGKADYCRRLGTVDNVDSTVACTLSTGGGFGATVTSGVLDWGTDSGFAWTDVNGDGKADYCRRVGSASTGTRVACTLSTGTGFGSTITSPVLDWGYDGGVAWVTVPGGADYCRRVGGVNMQSSFLACTPLTGTGFGTTVVSSVVDWGYDSGASWVAVGGAADYCRRVGGANLQSSFLACTPFTGNAFSATVVSSLVDWGYASASVWVVASGGADYCRRVGSVNLQTSYVSCTPFTGTSFGTTIASAVIDWGYSTGAGWGPSGTGVAYCRRVGGINLASSYVACTPLTGTAFGASIVSSVVDWGYDGGIAWVDATGTGNASYCRRVGGVNMQSSYVSCTPSTSAGFGLTFVSAVIDWGVGL